jgi:hypothetical protein
MKEKTLEIKIKVTDDEVECMSCCPQLMRQSFVKEWFCGVFSVRANATNFVPLENIEGKLQRHPKCKELAK